VIFTAVEAGLALNQHSSCVNGLIPLRRGFAGFFFVLIFIRPATLNVPGPLRPKSFLIMTDMQSNTDATSLRERPVSFEISLKIWDFVRGLVSVVFALFFAVFLLAMEFESFHWSNSFVCFSSNDRGIIVARSTRECTEEHHHQQGDEQEITVFYGLSNLFYSLWQTSPIS
jgi:hypothetical protein